MTLFKRWLVIKLCLLMVLPMQAWPQALPSRANSAISGLMQQTMIKRGFAANDPRYAATLSRIGPSLAVVAGTAATVAAGTITAPAWITAGIAVGVGLAVTYAVGLAVDATVEWLIRPDGKIDQFGKTGALDSSNGLTAGEIAWTSSLALGGGSFRTIWGGDGVALARQAEAARRQVANLPAQEATCTVLSNGTQVLCGSTFATKTTSGAPQSCPKGTYSNNGLCVGYAYPATQSVPDAVGITVQQAISNLPEHDLNQPVSPAILAALANRAWRNAASEPGYDGLPYPESSPITSADASSWMASNPTLAPTVRDIVAPNPSTAAQPNPWALPAQPGQTAPAQPAPSTNPAAQNPQQNLGPDPGIGAPTLESIPTANDIVRPILDLTPELRNFQASGQAGQCPRPSFDLLGRTHVLEAHCTLIDQNKSVMQAAMVLAWAVIALLIILAA